MLLSLLRCCNAWYDVGESFCKEVRLFVRKNVDVVMRRLTMNSEQSTYLVRCRGRYLRALSVDALRSRLAVPFEGRLHNCWLLVVVLDEDI